MTWGDISKEVGIDDKYLDPRRDEKAVKLAYESYDNTQQCIEVIYKLFNDNEKEFYANGYRAVYPEYKFNPRLEAMYHWLTKLGYQMSSEEKLIAAGTHEIFQQNIFEGGNR